MPWSKSEHSPLSAMRFVTSDSQSSGVDVPIRPYLVEDASTNLKRRDACSVNGK